VRDIYHEDDVLRTFIQFIKTAKLVLKYADAHMYKKERLSTIRLTVMLILARNEQGMHPSELAEWTQTERHNVTALISRMKNEGMVTAEPAIKDKRRVNITLTDKGREALYEAMPAAKEVVDNIMLSMTKNDINMLEKLLVVLRENAYRSMVDIS